MTPGAGASGFSIVHRVESRSIAVMSVGGRFRAAAAAELRHRANADLDAGRTNFLVDLSDATAVDAAGIAALAWLDRLVEARGGRCFVVVPRDTSARRMFVLTRFDEVLWTAESREAALALAGIEPRRHPPRAAMGRLRRLRLRGGRQPVAATPTTAWPSRPAPEPSPSAEPNGKVPPSAATSQYPAPSALGDIPTIGRARRTLPVDPKPRAPGPNGKIPPSAATSQ
jgi:anti-sigma B factor antagonist